MSSVLRRIYTITLLYLFCLGSIVLLLTLPALLMTKTYFSDKPRIEFFAEDHAIGDISEQRVRLHNGRIINRNTDESYCSAFSPDGTLLAWSRGNGFIDVIRLPVKSQIQQSDFQKCHCSSIDCSQDVITMAFSPVATRTGINCTHEFLLATGLACGKIKLWNTDSGELVYNLCDHRESISGLSFMKAKELLLISSSKDGTLKVWDLNDDGNMTLTLKRHPLPILDCSCSPTAPLICSVGQGRMVFLWMLEHKRSAAYCEQLRGHNNDVTSSTWSPDGALLATASNDTTVILWDPQSTQQIMVLGHVNPLPEPIFAGGANGSWLTCVRFSPNGSQLATLCEDNRLRVWNLWFHGTSRSVAVNKPGTEFTFSPDGSIITVGHADGSLSLLEVGVTVMPLQHLCRLAIRRAYSASSIKELQLPPFIRRYLRYVSHET